MPLPEPEVLAAHRRNVTTLLATLKMARAVIVRSQKTIRDRAVSDMAQAPNKEIEAGLEALIKQLDEIDGKILRAIDAEITATEQRLGETHGQG